MWVIVIKETMHRSNAVAQSFLDVKNSFLGRLQKSECVDLVTRPLGLPFLVYFSCTMF